jgi:hypothetical protein
MKAFFDWAAVALTALAAALWFFSGHRIRWTSLNDAESSEQP